MRTTITIDDKLFEEAAETAGTTNASEVVKLALHKFIAAESKKRLIALGGSAPDFEVPGRGGSRYSSSTAAPLGLVAEESPSITTE